MPPQRETARSNTSAPPSSEIFCIHHSFAVILTNNRVVLKPHGKREMIHRSKMILKASAIALSVLGLAVASTVSMIATDVSAKGNGGGNGGGNGNGNGNGNGVGNGAGHGVGNSPANGSAKGGNKGANHAKGHGNKPAKGKTVNAKIKKVNANPGRGAIASELKGRNAVNASATAFANASPNSMVGQIATYSNAVDDLAEAETDLADAEKAVVDAEKAVADAKAAVETAQKALNDAADDDAKADAKDALEDAEDDLETAEGDLAKAEDAAKDAEKAVADAETAVDESSTAIGLDTLSDEALEAFHDELAGK